MKIFVFWGVISYSLQKDILEDSAASIFRIEQCMQENKGHIGKGTGASNRPVRDSGPLKEVGENI
jgi:hypothetical protein